MQFWSREHGKSISFRFCSVVELNVINDLIERLIFFKTIRPFVTPECCSSNESVIDQIGNRYTFIRNLIMIFNKLTYIYLS